MRRLLITLFCLAALSTVAFAQDDHNDAGPLTAGYAVVTATSFGPFGPFGLPAGGLVVFETFGYRSQIPALQAGILPATMTTRMVLFVSSGLSVPRNTGVAITNPGSTDAVVVMTLRHADGSLTSTKAFAVAAKQQLSQFITQLFANVPEVSNDFSGTLTLTSNTPVAIMAMRFGATTFSTIPITSLSPSVALPQVTAATGGIYAMLMPQFAVNSLWVTETIVLNTSPAALTVRIDLYKQDGTPLVTTLNHQTGSSFQNLVIAPGGIIIFSPRNASGVTDF